VLFIVTLTLITVIRVIFFTPCSVDR